MFGHYRRHSLASSMFVLVAFYLLRLTNIMDFSALDMALKASDKHSERTELLDSIVVPDAPPEELAKSIEAAADEATKAKQTLVLENNLSPELAMTLFTGVKTADKLIDHPDATDQQRSTARRKKLMLLYVGAQADRGMFGKPMCDYADQLTDEDPTSDLAILGTGLEIEIRCFTDEMSKDDVLPKLVDYAKTYPKHPAGIELFRLYGEYLQKKEDPTGARECYEQAIALYGDIPATGALQNGLRKAKLAEAQLAIQRRGERLAEEARQVQIKRKLGNYPDGYFVVYAEENVKPPRNGGIHFYRYEYEVLEDVPAVVSYDKDLPAKWSWKLVERFPANAQGRDQAYDLWKKLLKKKKSSTFG